MRKILWIVTAIVCLIPITFIGLAYMRAPAKDVYAATKGYIAISQQYINGQQIDIASLEGGNVNADSVKIYADYLNKLLGFNNQLSQIKNNLVILVQPAKLAIPQSVYEDLEKQIQYDQEIDAIQAQREAAVQETANKMDALDKKKLKVVDSVSFIESLNKEKPERDKEIQQYKGLSLYIKQLLEFVKSRNGYYQLGQDGFIRFSREEDQKYYVQLVNGINQYATMIEALREEHSKQDRKAVNDMSAGK